jgi:DNA-directed RNA polymerase subunit RPC12/RpoP
MPIPVICSKCSERFKVKDHLAGKLIRCPTCSEDVLVSNAKPKPQSRPRKSAPAEKDAAPLHDDPPADIDIKRRPSPPVRMPKKLKVALIVAGSVFVLLCVSCGIWATWEEQAKKAALVYNQVLTQAHDRLVRSRNALSENIDRARFAPADTLDKVTTRRRHEEFRTAIDSIRGELSGWKPPSGARNLHQGYQRYLDYAQSELPQFVKAMAIVADPTLLDEQRETKAGKILDELDAGEKKSFDELENLQREFAGRYGIMLMPRARPAPTIIMTPQMRDLIERSRKNR